MRTLSESAVDIVQMCENIAHQVEADKAKRIRIEILRTDIRQAWLSDDPGALETVGKLWNELKALNA